MRIFIVGGASVCKAFPEIVPNYIKIYKCFIKIERTCPFQISTHSMKLLLPRVKVASVSVLTVL